MPCDHRNPPSPLSRNLDPHLGLNRIKLDVEAKRKVHEKILCFINFNPEGFKHRSVLGNEISRELCGFTLPDPISVSYETSQEVRVMFTSDTSNEFEGFAIKVTFGAVLESNNSAASGKMLLKFLCAVNNHIFEVIFKLLN